MLPTKRSNKWIIVCIIYTLLILTSFVINRILIQTFSMSIEMLRLLFFSVLVAIPPCLAGYIGQQLFFYLYSLFTIIGIVYMMYIVYANVAQGWEDLISILSFIMIVLVGFVVSFIAQLIYFIVIKRK